MKILQRLRYYHIDWVILFIGSFLIRVIGLNYGLPYEHDTDDNYYFGKLDVGFSGNPLMPPLYHYGYIFYYLTYLISFLARVLVKTGYIREYEILFNRYFVVILTCLTVIAVYELSRRILKDRTYNFLSAALFGFAVSNVISSRYPMVDNLIVLMLVLTLIVMVEMINSKKSLYSNKLFFLGGLTASAKFGILILIFSWDIVIAAKEKIFATIKNFKSQKLITLFKLNMMVLAGYILGNIFALFYPKTWLGQLYYQYRAYSTDKYFYFQTIHTNFFEHLWTIIRFIFADYFVLTPFTEILAVILLGIFIFKSKVVLKTQKEVFIPIILFIAISIVSFAKADVFMARNLLPLAPLVVLVLVYPVRNKIINNASLTVIALLALATVVNSVYAVVDVSKKNVESQMFQFVDNHQGKYAFPNVMRYPDIIYAYYSPEIKVSLDDYSFFRENKDRLIFYRSDSDFNKVIQTADYFITTEQMLQSLNYHEANRQHILPHYEILDIPAGIDIQSFLISNHFVKKVELETSQFETILKYDPASLNLKRITIYEKD